MRNRNSDCCARAAAGGGHLDCLQYAHEHGCPWDVNTCASAVFGEQLHCLQYAREHGCPWEEESVFTLPPDDDL